MNKYLTGFDNSVTPHGFENSFLRELSTLDVHGLLLRTGRVVKYWEPSGDRLEPEYDVAVDDYSSYGIGNRFILYRCRMACGFGSVADFVRWTPRLSTNGEVAKLGPESRVLVMCINGRMTAGSGIIVGALPHHENAFDKDKGHHYTWQFNGIKKEVDKKGQYRLTFSGATNADGTASSQADKNASGATFQITKDGSIKLFTKDESQFLDFNHVSKTVALTSDKGTMFTCRSGLIKTSSTGVHLGTATDDMIKGTTYRTQEAALHSSMQTAVAALGTSLAAVAAGLTTTVAAATPNPLTVALTPGLTAAATALKAAQEALASLATAISTFESQAAAYLSTKNKLD